MSWLVAPLYDRIMRGTEAACLAAWRAELLADLEGDVLEIGAGTGANIAHYGPRVERVRYFEPDPHMARQLKTKLAADPKRGASDEVVEDLAAVADESHDAVVSTLVLCTVPDPTATLAHVRRVLAPHGRFVFLEHVAAHEHPERLAWQRRLEPLWKRVAGGCHLTRETAQTIADAGFTLEQLQRESMRKAVPWVRPTVRGVAIVR
ncbi:MAG: methyltransferase domain-containing protein [Deltaproteobacteria bacterium]|jgi:SAM-dependent methyltransferase